MALLLQEKVDSSERIVLIDNLTYAGDLRNLSKVLSASNIEFIKADISDKRVIRDIIEPGTMLVNFAAESHVDRSILSGLPFLTTNILGAFQLLEVFHEAGGETFLQVSTDEVYGSLDTGAADESSTLDPNSPYAASKASADLMLMSYARTNRIDLRITRCGNNFGPRQHPEKLIPKVISSVLLEKQIPIYGDGMNIRNWIYVEDHCKAIWEVLTNGTARRIYNIAGKSSYSNIVLVRNILRRMDYSNENISYIADRLGHDFRYAINADRINLELGYEPSNDFDESLARTIDWYIDNVDWWQSKISESSSS